MSITGDQVRNKVFLNEIKGGYFNLTILAEVKRLSADEASGLTEAYTQQLIENVMKILNEDTEEVVKRSTCYTRLRQLRASGLINEQQSKREGKSIIGYTITDDGREILASLIKESKRLLDICNV